jgi:hypothetical protein
MEIRLDHPEVLSDFETAPSKRVFRWTGFAIVLWMVLVAADWGARFRVFRWQDQWLPAAVPASSIAPASPTMPAKVEVIPAHRGSGLTAMLGIPWMARR